MAPWESNILGLSSPRWALAGVFTIEAIPRSVLAPVLELLWDDIMFILLMLMLVVGTGFSFRFI